MDNLKNIMVAVDFNDSIGELMVYADNLAEKFGSKVWVLHVADPEPDFVGYEPGPQYIRDIKADEYREEHRNLQEVCKNFLSEDTVKEALLIQGSTVETVVEEAKKLNIDLLIVGTHKHSFLHNLLQESVSMELIKKAEIPILTIPIDE
ncbi:nucleotide-binding universal stress UspA family protein [Christiangramia gaetbulicola]|uniref:Universal stress protein n=1 Tax=Christiangramia gaetbulicola TaxID=703340 RepID=A0A2T6AKP1_9FLAO|nr:universal stress protein [Christiangramia gaetbulicola]PTX44306.1 nucleotide-binding universal stress UspA family protein [Christiangramia gaetbulicola]